MSVRTFCPSMVAGGRWALLAAVVTPSALAATYEYDLDMEVCMGEPASGHAYTARAKAYDLSGESVSPTSFTAQYWDGDSWEDWGWIECEVDADKQLWVTFRGEHGNWPSSWPDVRCTGSYTGNTHILTIDTIAASRCSQTATESGGDISIAVYPNQFSASTHAVLSASTRYACESQIQAKKSNDTTWTGVTCTVRVLDWENSGDVQILEVQVLPTAVETSGYCDVPQDSDDDGDIDGSDTPLRVDISLDRL